MNYNAKTSIRALSKHKLGMQKEKKTFTHRDCVYLNIIIFNQQRNVQLQNPVLL